MSYSVIGALAAVEINKAGIIPLEAVELACSFLEKRYDCADFYAIDLLVLYFLYADHPALRAQVKERIERAFLDFKFWIDEPGLDAMCYHTENHQILFHVSAYLAGELWPERIFPNSGLSGRRQEARAPRIAEWIRRRLGGAFSEWDSSSYLALDAYAMLALVEFAGSARLCQMAAALLDKIFFSLACQSWRGVHGCTHGRAYASTLKSRAPGKHLRFTTPGLGYGNFQWREPRHRSAGAGQTLPGARFDPADWRRPAGSVGDTRPLQRALSPAL